MVEGREKNKRKSVPEFTRGINIRMSIGVKPEVRELDKEWMRL